MTSPAAHDQSDRDTRGFRRCRFISAGGMSLLLRRVLQATVCVALLAMLGGCATIREPSEFFELSSESQANKAMQTRLFETDNEKELLSASAAVFQDLGFQVEDVVREVGMLRAVKERSAREHGQDIGRFIVSTMTLCYVRITVDLHQKISAVLIIRPTKYAGMRSEVRVSFYRVVWKSDGYVERSSIPPGEQRMEMIYDPGIYEQFFAKLSKAVFLEAFTL
jgi:hypothetical protein